MGVLATNLEKKNVLILGSDGQLGQCIKFLVDNNITLFSDEYYFCGKKDIDITDKESLKNGIEKYKADIIINCAAYTNVEKAEEESEKAYNINDLGCSLLSEICEEKGIYLIHISTDFVFDGESNIPYKENDEVNPLNIYGQTKYNGENNILKNSKALVIRTSWLYSRFGKNFLKIILQRVKDKILTKVVCDQIGTPTNAMDLALLILFFIIKRRNFITGLYHFSNEGCCSWYDFAKAIEILTSNDKDKTYVVPCFNDEYPSKAKRPKYSVMNKSKIYNDLGDTFKKHWLESLIRCLETIK